MAAAAELRPEADAATLLTVPLVQTLLHLPLVGQRTLQLPQRVTVMGEGQGQGQGVRDAPAPSACYCDGGGSGSGSGGVRGQGVSGSAGQGTLQFSQNVTVMGGSGGSGVLCRGQTRDKGISSRLSVLTVPPDERHWYL